MKRMAVSLIVLFVITLLPGYLFAQQGSSHEAHHPEGAQVQGENPEEEKVPDQQMMQNMMSTHEQMMSKMKQMDADLDKKVQAMNAAKAEKDQIDAMRAVINEMISQKREMMKHMMGMHGKMCKMMGGMKGKGMQAMDEGTMKMHRMKGSKNMIVIIQE